jgi:glycosyltransferase involved in cell wall biosynthesis
VKIFILHPGKANYPEIDAYSAYFGARGFAVSAGSEEDYRRLADPQEHVLWCIMGFYTKQLTARFLIHDYRSLSVGRAPALKDTLKRMVQPRPNLRIFQNMQMDQLMDFRDDVDTIFLPMGVPDWIFSVNNDIDLRFPRATYAYIGEITRERGFDRFLTSFLKFRRPSETLALVGQVEKEIADAFGKFDCIVFTGRLSQQEALRVVRQSRYAVSVIPYSRPYHVQAPTKLLEYAALGKQIVCNDSPSNVNTAEQFGISCSITGADIFSTIDRERVEQTPANNPAFLRHLSWNSVIKQSGVDSYLDHFVARRQ